MSLELKCETCRLGQGRQSLCGRVGGLVLATAERQGHSTSEDTRPSAEVALALLENDPRLETVANAACSLVYREVPDVLPAVITV